jgi:hypothetical protein
MTLNRAAHAVRSTTSVLLTAQKVGGDRLSETGSRLNAIRTRAVEWILKT